MKPLDIVKHNQRAWDRYADEGVEWTIPVSHEIIEAARRGEWEVLLTEMKPVPRDWFPELKGCNLLCLAGSGGQQAPIFAAAGAIVTVLDNSPNQLTRDRLVADREGLEIVTVQGDMQDLSIFPDATFDLIFHPVSNLFVPDVKKVWRESYRVLKYQGTLLAGMVNPIEFAFDRALADEKEIFTLKHALPYSDLSSLTDEERLSLYREDDALEFSHTLEEQIGGQIKAGFVITGFYESYRANDPIAAYYPSYFATKALKL